MWWFISVAHNLSSTSLCIRTLCRLAVVITRQFDVHVCQFDIIKMCNFHEFLGHKDGKYFCSLCWMAFDENVLCRKCILIKSPLTHMQMTWCKKFLAHEIISHKNTRCETTRAKMFNWIPHNYKSLLSKKYFEYFIERRKIEKISLPVILLAILFHSIAPPFLFMQLF